MFLWIAFGLTSHLVKTLLHLQRDFAKLMVALRDLRMQVHVDDPILMAAGSREQRLRLFSMFWAVLVFDLSWRMEQRDRESRGFSVEFNLLQDGVAVSQERRCASGQTVSMLWGVLTDHSQWTSAGVAR